jgi:hypothetical protein
MPASREIIEVAFEEHLDEINLNDLARRYSLAELLYRLYRAGWIRGEAHVKRQQMDAEREAEAHRYVPPDATLLPPPPRWRSGEGGSRSPIASSARMSPEPPVQVTHIPMEISIPDEPAEPALPGSMTLAEASATAAAASPRQREPVQDLWPPAPGREETPRG